MVIQTRRNVKSIERRKASTRIITSGHDLERKVQLRKTFSSGRRTNRTHF